MALHEDQVREALKQVIDPELFVNIVDLGLIYVVDVKPADEDGKHKVDIDMTRPVPCALPDRNWLPKRRSSPVSLRPSAKSKSKS